jgi:hypothetical protein
MNSGNTNSTKLLNTSLDLKQKIMGEIFDYYKNLIFKNPIRVRKFETIKSEENWLKYEILYYKVQTFDLTISENIETFPSLQDYEEQNDYLIELRNSLLQIDIKKRKLKKKKKK